MCYSAAHCSKVYSHWGHCLCHECALTFPNDGPQHDHQAQHDITFSSSAAPRETSHSDIPSAQLASAFQLFSQSLHPSSEQHASDRQFFNENQFFKPTPANPFPCHEDEPDEDSVDLASNAGPRSSSSLVFEFGVITDRSEELEN